MHHKQRLAAIDTALTPDCEALLQRIAGVTGMDPDALRREAIALARAYPRQSAEEIAEHIARETGDTAAAVLETARAIETEVST